MVTGGHTGTAAGRRDGELAGRRVVCRLEGLRRGCHVPEGWTSGFGFNMKIKKKATGKKHQPTLELQGSLLIPGQLKGAERVPLPLTVRFMPIFCREHGPFFFRSGHLSELLCTEMSQLAGAHVPVLSVSPWGGGP